MRFEHFVDQLHLLLAKDFVSTITVVATGVSTAVQFPAYALVLFVSSFAQFFLGVGHFWCIVVIALVTLVTKDFVG